MNTFGEEEENMEILYNICLDCAHITKFLILADCFFCFLRRNHLHEKKLIYLLTALSSVILKKGSFNLTVSVVLYVTLVFFIYLIRYKESLVKLLIMSFWSSLILAIIDEISKVTVTTVITIVEVPSEYTMPLLKQILTLSFLIITGKMLKKRNRMGVKQIGFIYYICFTILSFLNAVILVYLSDFTINKVVVEHETIFQIVFFGVCAGILLQMSVVIMLAVSRDVYKEHQNLANDYLNEQKYHYEYLEKREHETKKFRHDLRQHIYMLHTLNQNGEYKKLDEYIEKMYGVVDSFGNRIYVNNGIVDAILNKFAAEAEKEGIWLDVKGHLPTENNIDAYELCTIFSNLLSNALEAERECGGKSIRVFCKYTSEHIIVCIENDTMEVKKKINGRNFTTKEDRWNHGFGLENVRECVEKNQGELLMESEGNIFRVTVMLNNES